MRSLASFAMVLAAVGCTQDFDAFNPVATGGTGVGGAGAGPSTGGGGAGNSGGVGATGGIPGGFGGTGDEDCGNTVDDDQDGDADCADSDCTPLFDCGPEVPAGWLGPVALAQGAAAVACDGAYTMLEIGGFAGILFDPAVCSACGCEEPAVTCTPGAIQPYDAAGCAAGDAIGSPIAQGLPCSNNDAPAGTAAVTIAPPVASTSGNCNETGGVPTLGAVTWQTIGTVCSTTLTPGGGCEAGDVCVPKTPTGFNATQCISQAGDQVCPGGYPNKNLYNTAIDDFVDTRDCDSCTCGAPAPTCDGTTSFYGMNSCNTNPTEVIDNDGACDTVAGWSSRGFNLVDSAAPCASGGGNPTGTVIPGIDLVTICCSS